jgi:hypothetical protein
MGEHPVGHTPFANRELAHLQTKHRFSRIPVNCNRLLFCSANSWLAESAKPVDLLHQRCGNASMGLFVKPE